MTVIRLADIREAPLDVDEVLRSLDDLGSGGVTLFVGRVRDHDHGKGVVALEYTAHPTALAQLRRTLEAVADKHEVAAVAALHRIGRLELGDIAVIVAAASGHRSDAFDASRALIDELKATVPIWKHQVFTDGTEEWVG